MLDLEVLKSRMLQNYQEVLYRHRTGTYKNGGEDEIRKTSRDKITKGNWEPFERYKGRISMICGNSVKHAWAG